MASLKEALNYLKIQFDYFKSKAIYFFLLKNKIKIIGITGTNGKGTTALLIQSILETAGKKTAVIGSIFYFAGGKKEDAELTTPTFSKIIKIITKAYKNKFDFVVIEVSSHGIKQKRIGNLRFHTKVFTNMSSDHLDYHKTQERYEESKLAFFKTQKKFNLVINNDDPFSKKILNAAKYKRLATYAIKKQADVEAENIRYSWNGTSFNLIIKNKKIRIRSKCIGKFNVYNVLAAATFASLNNISLDKIKKGIEMLKYIPGRFEIINPGMEFKVIIDYSNNTGALSIAFETLKMLGQKRIITLFGCEGGKKKSHRKEMARVVSENSDFCILTSHHPRNENKEEIISDMLLGFDKKLKKYEIETDRFKAIKKAVDMLKKGDTLFIPVKGHEDYEEISGRKIRFDDKIIVRKLLGFPLN